MSRYVENIETREDFKKILKAGRIIIVKASATWCGPCKKVAPLVKKLLESMPNNVFMLEIDVDENSDLATFFDIKKLPTFISYVGVDKMDVLIGSNEKDVKAFFNKVAAHASLDNISEHLYGSN